MTLPRQLIANAAKIGVVALLSLPALRAISYRDQTTENRALSAFPTRPSSWADTLKYPAKLDAWVNDHFGFRNQLLSLNNRVRYALFRQFPTSQVIAGQDDRIFLAAHEVYYPPYHTIHLTCGYQFGEYEKITAEVNSFRFISDRLGIDAKLLIAPSAPAIYREELPAWLAKRCASTAPPIKQIIGSRTLDASVRSSVYYPLDEMRAMKAEYDVIPKTWFHWAGAGSRLTAERSVEHFWKIDPQEGAPLKTKTDNLPSDLSHLFPGVNLKSKVDTIDFAGSGIHACEGGQCYPELQDIMDKLGDVARFINPRAPRQQNLVLVTDSFGHYIAGWYSRYYRNVMHLSTNAIGRLSEPEITRLRDYIQAQGQGGHVLFLYHDAGVLAGRLGMDLKKLGLDVIKAEARQ